MKMKQKYLLEHASGHDDEDQGMTLDEIFHTLAVQLGYKTPEKKTRVVGRWEWGHVTDEIQEYTNFRIGFFSLDSFSCVEDAIAAGGLYAVSDSYQGKSLAYDLLNVVGTQAQCLGHKNCVTTFAFDLSEG
jgi:hypothetical protein